MKISTKLINVERGVRHLDLVTNAATFRMMLLTDDIVRIRCTFEENFPKEASYSLAVTAWEDKLDALVPDRRKIEALPVQYDEEDTYILLSTRTLRIRIYKEPFGIEIRDTDGNLLHADLKERSYVRDMQGRLYHYTCMDDQDYYYGFGEKAGYLNKKQRRMRMHNVDTIGYDSEHTDPLYKHIPFYIKWSGSSRRASGLFYHNSHDSVFDMGCERSGYWNKYSYFCADGGELDVFFIHGPHIRDVVRHYTDLTGKTVLPAKYSLGYMGSTMYYTELEQDSDQAILGFLDKCREEGIPCDGFFLSSGYTTGSDGKRHVLHWNHDRFPDPKRFVQEMAEKGAALAPNIKPGMLITNPLYKEFDEAGAYIRNPVGEQSHMDRFWGGSASFVDFTNPQGRALWKKHLQESLLSLGITSIWNDNNEYEINDSQALCHVEGDPRPIAGLRPIMPNLMAQMAYEALEEVSPTVRPYIVNRAGFAGIQRYAQTWAGDNNTSWKSLKFNIPVVLGLGLSGVANQGCDIGGFFGPAPDPELFVRWVQNGIFQPRFSIHSCNTDNTVTEPWMYPAYTPYIREAIQLRYRLVPYFYSLLFEASTEGSPVMRPLVYEFQDDDRVYGESFDFMVGTSLLVANVLEQGACTREIYLPKGTEWVEWNTRTRYAGGQTVQLDVTLESIPMFIRSGSIIPMAPGLMNIHQDRVEHLHLLVEPSEEACFVWYDDDGSSNRYKQGDYAKTTIRIQKDKDTRISFMHEGDYRTTVQTMVVEVLCREVAPVQINLKGMKLAMFLRREQWEASAEGWFYDMEQKAAIMKYDNPHEDYDIRMDFDVKDLISI